VEPIGVSLSQSLFEQTRLLLQRLLVASPTCIVAIQVEQLIDLLDRIEGAGSGGEMLCGIEGRITRQGRESRFKHVWTMLIWQHCCTLLAKAPMAWPNRPTY
jgi:hypothetical protein